ncbi:MAG: TraR/DksA C4-type zinc finger protein [Candidatus Gottesmanbacteria bacterium]
MQSFPSDILKEIKTHFEKEKLTLTERIAELQKQDPFTDPERSNDNAASDTEASEESNHDRVSAMVDELKAKLHTIEDALVRIDVGTYGACTECNNMIDTERLSVLPMATLCLSCEQKKSCRAGSSSAGKK